MSDEKLASERISGSKWWGSWVTPKKIPNQIRLDGDQTPPQFMAAIPSAVVDERDTSTKQLLSLPFLRAERHFNRHYDENEVAIELALPWKITYGTKPWIIEVRRSVVIAFGRVHTKLAKGAWHVRGGLSTFSHYFE